MATSLSKAGGLATPTARARPVRRGTAPVPSSKIAAAAASEELVDLVAEGFDAGIRLGQFIAPDLVVVRLTPPLPFVVVGSPDYLRQRRQPERIGDLRDHACLRCCQVNLSRSKNPEAGCAITLPPPHSAIRSPPRLERSAVLIARRDGVED